MAKITAVLVAMCAFSAFVTYPSAETRRQSAMEATSQFSTSQVVPTLPTEPFEAI